MTRVAVAVVGLLLTAAAPVYGAGAPVSTV
jgi:hypothetical protein